MYKSVYFFETCVMSPVRAHWRDAFGSMVDRGANGVCFGVTEYDLKCTRQLDLACDLAATVGLDIWLVPSRWGGLIAGWPCVPSWFAATHPEAWMCRDDGAPNFRQTWGPMCSVHHEATEAFFRQCLERMLTRWPAAGLIWDEPKPVFHSDYSPAAKAAMPEGAGEAWHPEQLAAFFGRVTGYAKELKPGLRITLFVYCQVNDTVTGALSNTPHLDEFGCDGRPATEADMPELYGKEDDKVLVPQGERFVRAARAAGKRSYCLVENMVVRTPEQVERMHERLPVIAAYGFDHMTAYYDGPGVREGHACLRYMK